MTADRHNGLKRARPVLIADDDPTARLLIDRYLQAGGLVNPTVHLEDGAETMTELRRRADLGGDDVPALLLLDGQMPGRSGLDVLRWLADQPALTSLPVIVLSGQSGAADVNSAYALGARSVLVKPVGFEALGEVIRDLALPWQLA